MSESLLIAIYIILFISATGFSLLINSLMLKFSMNLGVRNKDQTVVRWATQSKPSLGGITFFICLLLAIIFYSVFVNEGRLFLNTQFIGFICASTLAFLMGLADDAYDTRPLLKFSVQFTCGMILIASGIYINIFSIPFLNYALTLVWVIGLMNSINMLDNMDAISTVVSIFIMAVAVLLMLIHRDLSNVFLMTLLGLIASLAGFLFFNWHPSRMYMGDTGSQLLGIVLATTGIIFFWNLHYCDIIMPQKQFILPVLVFIMPICDTTTVVINRLLKKQSPFVGGKDHTTHAMVYLGFSESQVAMIFAFVTFISATLVILTDKLINWNNLVTLVFSLYILLVFGVMFGITRYNILKNRQ